MYRSIDLKTTPRMLPVSILMNESNFKKIFLSASRFGKSLVMRSTTFTKMSSLSFASF